MCYGKRNAFVDERQDGKRECGSRCGGDCMGDFDGWQLKRREMASEIKRRGGSHCWVWWRGEMGRSREEDVLFSPWFGLFDIFT